MMQTWFEAKLTYVKVTELGSKKKVTEPFILDAVSFTDAETRMIKQAQCLVRGEFKVKDIKQSNLSEIFPYENGEWWFKVKISLITIDEEAGREKRINTYYLVMADNAKEAFTRIEESLSFLLVPYEVLTLTRTQIADVFPYDVEENAAEMQRN